MKTVQNETLGFKLNIQVPDSVEEFDRLAGKQGAALDEANKNVIYRGWNADFRKKLIEQLEKTYGAGTETNIPRAVIGKGPKREKDGVEPDIFETEKKYVDRLIAGGISLATMQPTAESIGAAIAFDPSAAERSTKIGKEYLELADGVIAKGPQAVDTAVTKLLGLNPTFGDVERYAEGDENVKPEQVGQVTRESLASLIRANTMRKASEDLV